MRISVKHLPVLISLLLVVIPCGAQNKSRSDSLTAILNTGSHSDSARYELLKRIAFNHPEPIKSLYYAREALSLAESLQEPILIARALEEISTSQRTLGNTVQALETSLQALQIYEKHDEKSRMAGMYLMIGSNYTSDANFRFAVPYLFKAMRIYEFLKSENLLPIVYTNLGETYRLMHVYDSAEYYTNKSLELATRLGNQPIIGYSLGNLGMINVAHNKFALANEQLKKAIVLLNDLGDGYSVSVYTSELGKAAFMQGAYDQAKEKYLDAFQIAEDYKLKEQLRDFSKLLVEVNEKTGNLQEALRYQKTFQIYQDSIVNVKNIRSISELTAKYELDKQQAQIVHLNERAEISKYRMYALMGSLMLFFVLVAVLYLSAKKRKKANRLLQQQKEQIELREKEKELFLNELNHRTKNNLQTISSILSLQSRELIGHPSYDLITEGKSRVDALSLIHQKLYQDSFQIKIQLKEYIEELLYNLVFGFNKHIQLVADIVDCEMSVDRAVPLALVVNELATNSIKYAFHEVKSPLLEVRLSRLNDQSLLLEIRDNGSGIEDTALNGDSFGLKLVKSLVQQLTGNMEYRRNEPGSLWRVTMKKDAGN